MKFGTIIDVPGRGRATVVYNGLDGCGIAWGEYSFTEEDEQIAVECATFNMFSERPWHPTEIPAATALLREPFKNAHMECVGEDYEIISEKEHEES